LLRMRLPLSIVASGAWLTGAVALVSTAAAKQAPPPPAGKISYEQQIRPLLKARCAACHGNGSRLGGFQIDTRESLITGGQNHPAVIPGKGAESYLIKLVSGVVPGKVMPARGPRLTAAEVALLTRWIDEGVSFGNAGGAAAWRPKLALEAPRVPPAIPGSGVAHPIDRIVAAYWHRPHPPAPSPSMMERGSRSRSGAGAKGDREGSRTRPIGAVVDDRTYARRVYLDLVGLLPPPEELLAFEKDRSSDKRARLARRLLADNQKYAEHWLTFWNDLLRNDYAGTGYIDGGRQQITEWLYAALHDNKPYDRFVAELVNPTPESAGFAKGIVWRGVVNASQRPEMQAAQHISQVFMGVNLKCASCHDSFISTWKLADAYGMAGIYADAPLEMVRCDKPMGQVAAVRFLYPELGAIDGQAPRARRLQQLAGILTGRTNGRLARTLVNRLWGKLMGRGLVEPHDEMDNRPWSPELLDWLAADFRDHGYDIRRTLEQIVTSRAYQMPAVGLPSENAGDFRFAGPVVKRMSAEQLVDAISALTDVWSEPAAQFRISQGQLVLPPGLPGKVLFRSEVLRSGSVEIDVDVTGAKVLSLVATDAGNGGNSDWADWADPRLVGSNGEIRLTDLKWHSASTGYGQIRLNQSVVEKPLRLGDRTFANGIGTHANSVITYLLPPGTTRFRATAGPDAGALESPGAQTSIRLYVVAGDRRLVETRAALAVADPLTRALGRPNREQVVTQRATVATTLQALELTNGQTLAQRLAQGAKKWTEERGATPAGLVDRLYLAALGRPPLPAERAEALRLVGAPAREDGVEDLLWALVMLPEFQLIY
jgi:mono/diheme cytochrome c family protein